MNTHWTSQGDGQPLVLIHGVGLDLGMWDEAAAALAAGGCCVLRYDLPGHGATPPAAGQLTLAECTAQLAGLLDARGIGATAIVGFSLGALVARAFAVDYPDRASHLVLLNSVYARSEAQRDAVRARCAEAAASGLHTLIEPALQRWFTPDFAAARPQVLARVRARLQANTPAGFLPAYRLFADAPDETPAQLQGIRAPTLVITGDGDVGSTPAMSRRLAQAIPAARCEVVAGARHMLPVECAAWLVPRVLEFVSCTTA